jgi:hypothetical protein
VPAARTEMAVDMMIPKAKLHSTPSGKSLSKMVAGLFSNLPYNEQQTEYSLTPEVRALHGVLVNKNLTEADYRKHIEAKHK